MNLYCYYPKIYWQCAVLTINASANEDDEDNGSTNYGKLATSVNSMRQIGVNISLPDINLAGFGFVPIKDEDRIIFGLKSISGVGDEDAFLIIRNRPYSSLVDFCEKLPELTNATIVSLVKAGSFDSFIPNREEAAKAYLEWLATQKVENKTSINMQNFPAITKMAYIVPEHLSYLLRLFHFRKYITSPEFSVEKKVSCYLDGEAKNYFEKAIFTEFEEETDYFYDAQGRTVILLKPFEKKYQKMMKPIKDWVASPDTVILFNKASRDSFIKESYEAYFDGTVPSWEMASLNFYYGEHELANVNETGYGIVDFNTLSPTTEPVEVVNANTGRTNKQFPLSRIAGTVIDKNKNKHTITLLTAYGVVTVKFYAGDFSKYDSQISVLNSETGKKNILEGSWFKRGRKLLLTGYRRGENFQCRTYWSSVYPNAVMLVTGVNNNGIMGLQSKRASE